jgi:hypothetical protein
MKNSAALYGRHAKMWSNNTTAFGFRFSLPFAGERQREGVSTAITLSYILSPQGRGANWDLP